MKDMTMEEWQVTQIFLSDTGVHNVEINLETARLRCDCPGSSSRTRCKHTSFVQNKMLANNGIYPVEVSNKASREESSIAKEDPENFRQFLIKYGRVEVL